MIAPVHPAATISLPEVAPTTFRRIRLGIKTVSMWIVRRIVAAMRTASWIGLVALLVMLPVVQVLGFGYMLRAAGHVASGGKWRDSLPHFELAGRIALGVIAVMLAAVPAQLLVHYETVAQIVEPHSRAATTLHVLAWLVSLATLVFVLWSWSRGGRISDYGSPEPTRFVREALQWRYWDAAVDRLWELFVSLEIPATFWFGLRALVGTLIWLIPAWLVMLMVDRGRTGLAGLVGAIGLIATIMVMQYLPFLQMQFASSGRWRDLFSVSTVRRRFRSAPYTHAAAALIGLLLLPLPLYALKIEMLPSEVLWWPCIAFVAFLLPARLIEATAVRRGDRLAAIAEPSRRWYHRIGRMAARLTIFATAAFYVLVVYLSQFIAWEGIATWIGQHAVALPVPFLDGQG